MVLIFKSEKSVGNLFNSNNVNIQILLIRILRCENSCNIFVTKTIRIDKEVEAGQRSKEMG